MPFEVSLSMTLCIKDATNTRSQFTMISIIDEETELHLLRQRNRVLAALCGLELDAGVEFAASSIQEKARARIQRKATRQLHVAFHRFRGRVDEICAATALLHLSFCRFQKACMGFAKERSAAIVQAHVRGMNVRKMPAIRLLWKLREERKRVIDLELSILFLQKHQKSRRSRFDSRKNEWGVRNQ